MRDSEQLRQLVQWLMHPRCNGNIKVNIWKGAWLFGMVCPSIRYPLRILRNGGGVT